MSFVDYEITTDEDELIQQYLDNLTAAFPGISLNENHLEVASGEELARLVLNLMRTTADVSEGIFREYGRKVAGLPPVDATPATFLATITAIDDDGHLFPAGTRIAYRRTADELWVFESTADANIPALNNSVGNVPFASIDLTEDRNGIAAGTEYELVDNLFWVDSIVSTTVTAGGSIGDTDDAYLERLTEEVGLLGPRPILPNDFAILAKRTNGVYRAVAIDGYDPATQTYGNDRFVTVAAVDQDGFAASAAVRDAMRDDLDDKREINFVVEAIDPTFTQVRIVFEAVAFPGADIAAVETAAENAVEDYISPATWGGGNETPAVWRLQTAVRLYEIAAVINAVPGIDYITLLTINEAAADFILPGAAPLPRKAAGAGGDSTVEGTVVAP